MIAKERLLAGLNEFINVEEGLITIYANFSKALLKETRGPAKEAREKITKLLSVLYRDSSRHKELIAGMIIRVAEGKKDEY